MSYVTSQSQAPVFRGSLRGFAQKAAQKGARQKACAAQKAARQAEQEWSATRRGRAAGENGPALTTYVPLGERAARQQSSSLNMQLPKARELN